MKALVCLLLVAAPTTASAQTVAVWVEGHEPAATRQALRSGLERAGLTLVPDGDFAATMSAVGLNEVGDRNVATLSDGLSKAAEGVGADAIVIVYVQKPRGKRQLVDLRVVDATGGQVAEATPVVAKVKGRKRRKKFKQSFRALVEAAVAAIRSVPVAPAEASTEPEATPETPTVETPAEPEPPAAQGGSIEDDTWDAGEGVLATALGMVELTYTTIGRYHIYDNLASPGLRGYAGFGVPGFRVALQLYPFAAMSDVPALHDIGIAGGFSMPIGLRSKITLENNTEVIFNTDAFDWEADLVYRLDLRPVMLFINAGLGQLVFDFGAVGTSEGMPGVSYLNFRAGFTVGLDFQYVRIFIGTSYTQPLSVGAVGEAYYPGSSAIAFDSRFGFDIRLYAGFGLYAGLRHRVFLYSPGTPTGLAAAVDGITDHHLHLDSGLRWVF